MRQQPEQRYSHLACGSASVYTVFMKNEATRKQEEFMRSAASLYRFYSRMMTGSESPRNRAWIETRDFNSKETDYFSKISEANAAEPQEWKL